MSYIGVCRSLWMINRLPKQILIKCLADDDAEKNMSFVELVGKLCHQMKRVT